MVSPLTAPVTTAVSAGFSSRILLIAIGYYCYSNTFGVTLKIPLVETTIVRISS
jgi:hypothetical protein